MMTIHGTVAVTGHKGRLGSMLVNPSTGFVPLDCDIKNYGELVAKIKEVDPSIIINCAAYTDVDGAEMFTDDAFEINKAGAMKVREAFKDWVIHLSTDYIFGGSKGPYSEIYNVNKDMPRSAYGKSKLYGEEYITSSNRPGTVIRTTMLYGNPNFPDFVTKILSFLKNGYPFEVPHTLIGSPTYIPHLIEGMIYLMSNYQYNPPPIINISGSDVISRYEFALMIASVFGYDKELIIPSMKIPGEAKRPHKAGLRVGKADKLGIPIYSAIEGLEAYKRENENIHSTPD